MAGASGPRARRDTRRAEVVVASSIRSRAAAGRAGAVKDAMTTLRALVVLGWPAPWPLGRPLLDGQPLIAQPVSTRGWLKE